MKSIFGLVLFVVASVAMTMAQGTYTQIDVPGSIATICSGINTNGDIVGWYVDATKVHGFLLSGGVYTTIDYPGAPETTLRGVNDAGEIVGFTSSNPVTGFLYDVSTQTYTVISYPNAGNTYPYAINASGVIAGTYFDVNRNTVYGFELLGSSYKQIVPPGAQNARVSGISSSGVLAGYVTLGSFPHHKETFLFNHGSFEPIALAHATGVAVSGIDPAGTALVGQYYPTSTTTAGFLYQIGSLRSLQFPGSSLTSALGVNSADTVVGYFYDSSFNAHGFTWTSSTHEALK